MRESQDAPDTIAMLPTRCHEVPDLVYRPMSALSLWLFNIASGAFVMSPAQPRIPILTVFVLVLACSVVSLASVQVLNAEVYVDDLDASSSRPSAVASDLEPLSAEDVAREVFQLQRQMGGSVVDNRPQLQDWQDAPSPVTPQEAPRWSPYPRQIGLNSLERTGSNLPSVKVAELREAAWQLDSTAHRLEKLDLYDQADALRNVANRLRHDARDIKQHAKTSAAAASRFPPSKTSTRQPE